MLRIAGGCVRGGCDTPCTTVRALLHRVPLYGTISCLAVRAYTGFGAISQHTTCYAVVCPRHWDFGSRTAPTRILRVL